MTRRLNISSKMKIISRNTKMSSTNKYMMSKKWKTTNNKSKNKAISTNFNKFSQKSKKKM